MTYPYSDSLNAIGSALDTFLQAEKAANRLQVRDVWYAMDGPVPETPAVIIEPVGKNRDIQETGFTTVNTFQVNITLLHSRLDSQRVTNKEMLELAEELEEILHGNPKLGGLVIHSFVRSIEAGLATRQRVTLRAARLLWVATSKTRLR